MLMWLCVADETNEQVNTRQNREETRPTKKEIGIRTDAVLTALLEQQKDHVHVRGKYEGLIEKEREKGNRRPERNNRVRKEPPKRT